MLHKRAILRRREYLDLISVPLFHLHSSSTLFAPVVVVETSIHGRNRDSWLFKASEFSSSPAHRVIHSVLWSNRHISIVAGNHSGLVSPLVRVAIVFPWEIHLHFRDLTIPLLGHCTLPLLLGPRLAYCSLGLVP